MAGRTSQTPDLVLQEVGSSVKNYDMRNWELLAIVMVQEEWWHWLEGALYQIAVFTDFNLFNQNHNLFRNSLMFPKPVSIVWSTRIFPIRQRPRLLAFMEVLGISLTIIIIQNQSARCRDWARNPAGICIITPEICRETCVCFSFGTNIPGTTWCIPLVLSVPSQCMLPLFPWN